MNGGTQVKERKYGFRQRLAVVHRPDRRNPHAAPEPGETEITGEWRIAFERQASPVVANAAKDLQDFFFESMHVSVALSRAEREEIVALSRAGDKVIVLTTEEALRAGGEELTQPRSYRIAAEKRRIVVCGGDERGTAQGSYYLEDLMNLREAPFLRRQDVVREPLFSPRMVHSGWGLDHYPDAHLNAMAHAGIDAVLVFVKAVDRTPNGYLDFNDLIDRAERYGLDVYMYSLVASRMHPDDPRAEEYYDSTYGQIFAACPKFKGIVFVGESCEFPSRDPQTTGTLRLDWPEDKPQTKPHPGWWPCCDYPAWLNRIKQTVRKYNPDVDIVFWTYNWGKAPQEDRLRLIRSLPEDITLLATFEMFEPIRTGQVTNVCVDYTISYPGPGAYFRSEAEAARERGLRLYTMCNTGGLTWDIGVIPYEPVPHQWAQRHAGLLQARSDWGLSGLMESHHYGWWPSFIGELAKWTYWSPGPPVEDIHRAIAQRDFSAEGAPYVLEAWKYWSEGIRHYVPTNEDQYGPFRVGPSYPLIFRVPVRMPKAWHAMAMFDSPIVLTNYEPELFPYENPSQSPAISRSAAEIGSLERMKRLWEEGNACLEKAILLAPERKQAEANRLLLLNRFIVCCVRTTIHAKTWWLLKKRLFLEQDKQAAGVLLAELERVALREIGNAEAAVPLVEADSRLGWEPSMDYMTDREHLLWKIAQVRTVLDHEFPLYRQSLALTD